MRQALIFLFGVLTASLYWLGAWFNCAEFFVAAGVCTAVVIACAITIAIDE